MKINYLSEEQNKLSKEQIKTLELFVLGIYFIKQGIYESNELLENCGHEKMNDFLTQADNLKIEWKIQNKVLVYATKCTRGYLQDNYFNIIVKEALSK